MLEELTRFLADRHIQAGVILGIGAIRDVTIGAYVSRRGEYAKVELDGEWELLSFNATVALVDSTPFVHPHVVLGDEKANVKGGHLFEARVAVTGEFTILGTPIPVSREMDPDVGLKLWRFDEDD